jgi:hypothetical protein
MRSASYAILFTGLLQAAAVDPVLVRTAVHKALPPLQQAGIVFWKNTGCVSCHHLTLPTMAVAMAREHGFAVDQDIEKQVSKLTADYLGVRTERILQGITPPGAEDTLSYVVFGLVMEQIPANDATDASARYLKIRQAEDGRWKIRAHRPPLESSAISLTAVTIRVLQTYAPLAQRDQYEKSIAKGARWLTLANASNTEESSFKVLGLVWANGARESIAQSAGARAKAQRPDGGWSQLPTLESDAYATGQALVALQAAGMKANDSLYERGVQFLLRTQLADGSWFVKSRTEAFQPYFETGFPHGHDQWISAAGTSWAIAALALTQPRIETHPRLNAASRSGEH